MKNVFNVLDVFKLAWGLINLEKSSINEINFEMDMIRSFQHHWGVPMYSTYLSYGDVIGR